MIRGHRFGGRLWRIIYEFLSTATDKRQGFRHTTGRLFFGTLISPSSILCEQARTKVPGEPLYIDDEDGWRPFLPLLDNVIGALDRGYPIDLVRVVSTEGVTEILPPRYFHQRIWARWALSRHFVEFAEQRNWQPGNTSHDPEEYVHSIQRYGFRIRFRPHDWQGAETDDRVTRFFPATTSAIVPLTLTPAIIDRANNYF